jgi:hypothetical protein
VPDKVIKLDITETLSNFKICLWDWKKGHGHDKEIKTKLIASQRLNFSEQVSILHDRLYLSADE